MRGFSVMKDKQSSSSMSDDNNPRLVEFNDWSGRLRDMQNTEQCFCQSYYDENNELKDCTCGKCGQNTEQLKKEINKLIRENRFVKELVDYLAVNYEVKRWVNIQDSLVEEIADYITKTTPSHDEIKREATEDIKKLLMSGKGRETGVWHYELNEANDMEASAFGDYLNIKEIAKAIEIYLTQSKEGGEDD